MSTQPKQLQPVRQIIGLSLAPGMARDVKAEAARRGVSLRKLFEEMWTQYQSKPDHKQA